MSTISLSSTMNTSSTAFLRQADIAQNKRNHKTSKMQINQTTELLYVSVTEILYYKAITPIGPIPSLCTDHIRFYPAIKPIPFLCAPTTLMLAVKY